MSEHEKRARGMSTDQLCVALADIMSGRVRGEGVFGVAALAELTNRARRPSACDCSLYECPLKERERRERLEAGD